MKTVSLELAKLLKDKGFPQDSYLEWFDYHGDFSLEKHVSNEFHGDDDKNYYAAPTADEILDLLPEGYFIYKIKLKDTGEIEWLISDKAYEIETTKNWERDKSLADAAAKMWIYLKENDLLGVK